MQRPFHSYTRPSFKHKGSRGLGFLTSIIVLAVIIFFGYLLARYLWHKQHNEAFMEALQKQKYSLNEALNALSSIFKETP